MLPKTGLPPHSMSHSLKISKGLLARVRSVTFTVFACIGLAACADSSEAEGQGRVPDFNGDGKVRIGVATDGPRDDGAYYEALVTRVEQISTDNGYEAPIIVDLSDAANSAAELRTIAEQGVDIIAIGSSGLADGNEGLFTEFDEIFWYCNCGSGYQDTPGLLRSQDSGAELNISAGYATGLLLQDSGGDSAVFLGCCDLISFISALTYSSFLMAGQPR